MRNPKYQEQEKAQAMTMDTGQLGTNQTAGSYNPIDQLQLVIEQRNAQIRELEGELLSCYRRIARYE